MKNKSVVMKILLCGSLILFLLLLVVIFSLIKLFFPDEKKKVEKKIFEKNYSIEEISNITFDLKKSNASFEITDGEELVVVQDSLEEKFYLNYKKKKNKLYFDEDIYIINPQKKQYIVYIPRSYINKVTIINGFGSINLDGFLGDIDINNNSGSIELKNIGNIQLKNVSGSMSFENVFGDIVGTTSTGNIDINNIMGKVNIESITGDITIDEFNTLGDSYLENVSGDIVIKLVDKAICKIEDFNQSGKTSIGPEICKDETNIIEVQNVTGIIKIY